MLSQSAHFGYADLGGSALRHQYASIFGGHTYLGFILFTIFSSHVIYIPELP